MKRRDRPMSWSANYLDPGEQVEPGVPRLPSDAALDRLEFARWLFRPEHPLTARGDESAMATYFGTGLVETADDFGRQGLASHPGLLDYLAIAFRRAVGT